MPPKSLVTFCEGLGNHLEAIPAFLHLFKRDQNLVTTSYTMATKHYTEQIYGPFCPVWNHNEIHAHPIKFQWVMYPGFPLFANKMQHTPQQRPLVIGEHPEKGFWSEVEWNLAIVDSEFPLEALYIAPDKMWPKVEPRIEVDVLLADGYSPHPPTYWQFKRYLHYPELAKALKKEGLSVGSLGRSNDIVPGTTKFSGTKLRDTVALMRGAKLVIANDTGAYHLAALLGIPTIVLFTGTCPAKNYNPVFHRSCVVVGTDLPCQPCQGRKGWSHCDRSPAGRHECRRFPVRQVMDVVRCVLNQKVQPFTLRTNLMQSLPHKLRYSRQRRINKTFWKRWPK